MIVLRIKKSLHLYQSFRKSIYAIKKDPTEAESLVPSSGIVFEQHQTSSVWESSQNKILTLLMNHMESNLW